MTADPADSRALFALFDDLEQQAEGLALAQRDDEVRERVRDEYSEVDLLARLHASVGRDVVLSAHGGGDLGGRLTRVGADWCLVEQQQTWGGSAREVLVHLPMLVAVRGLSDAAQPSAARPVQARLRFTSCLRRLCDAGGTHTLLLTDGSSRTGQLGRIGADFAEVWREADTVVVPLAATVWVLGG